MPSGSPGNVVSDLTSIYVGERDQVSRFPSFDAGTVGTVSAQFRGLCLSEQTGMNLIATSTTPNNKLHHASGSYPLPDGGVGVPLFGRGRGWLWINGTQSSTLSTFVLPLTSSQLQKVVETPPGVVFQGSPAMGSLRDGGSPLVYVATTDGLLVVDALDGGYWAMPGSPTADQPLSLDCARSSDGGGRSDRPGTLYTVSSSGIVTALIVDSQGLDGLAAWPRWQRSAGNTGSMVTALNPGCP